VTSLYLFNIIEGCLLSITGSASNLSELLFPSNDDRYHIDFNGGRTNKFYLAPILKFEHYKQFILSEFNQKEKSDQQITDNALKRAAWVTGGVHRAVQKAVEGSGQLFAEAAEMEGNQFKWRLNELINKWSSAETMNDLWNPSPLWTILLMFDQKSPSNEVILLSLFCACSLSTYFLTTTTTTTTTTPPLYY
jgi:hypothetical protein